MTALPDMRAKDVLRERMCTAGCLMAAGREAVVCTCPCGGRWHGVLADTSVPDSADFRPIPAPGQPGPDLLDELAAHAA